MVGLILYYLFIIAAFFQIIYWGIIFARLAVKPIEKKKDQEQIPISVVICAYNETENLKAHLPLILEQNYPHFEVLLVNDASSDDTSVVLSTFQQSYPHLKVLELEYPENHKRMGKKNPLSQGIQTCSHDIILVTDADCSPNSKYWISNMAKTIQGSTQIGLGYGPYQQNPGFLNKFIKFETIYTAIQYMSLSLWGQPYMGVGRNMIYKKELFYKVGGFEKHRHIASGDDDLFVNEISNGQNTEIVLDPKTFMYSPAMDTWRKYYKQKSRHLTTGRHYQFKHQVLLGLLSLSHFGFYIFGILLLINGFSIVFAATLFTSTLLLKTIVFAIISHKLDERRIIPYFLLLDVIYILYYIAFTPALAWGKTEKWK